MGSSGWTPSNNLDDASEAAAASGSSECHADGHRPRSLQQDPVKDARLSGAWRHPDPDLVRSLADQVGCHPIDAHGGEHHVQSAQEQSGKLLRRV